MFTHTCAHTHMHARRNTHAHTYTQIHVLYTHVQWFSNVSFIRNCIDHQFFLRILTAPLYSDGDTTYSTLQWCFTCGLNLFGDLLIENHLVSRRLVETAITGCNPEAIVQIELDLPRTFPDHVHFRGDVETPLIKKLRNLLMAYANRNKVRHPVQFMPGTCMCAPGTCMCVHKVCHPVQFIHGCCMVNTMCRW